MTEQQILAKAIKKARDNGFPWEEIKRIVNENEDVKSLVFNHEFAKALWGKDKLYRDNETGEPDETFEYLGLRWQYHLQQMVIANDPIKYLGENI